MNQTEFWRPRTWALAIAGALVLPLSACEPPSSSSFPVVRADLPPRSATKPLERREDERTARSPAVGPLIAQARAQPESPATPAAPQPAPSEVKPGLPKAPAGAGKPTTGTRPVSDAVLVTRVKSAVLAQPLSALMFNVNVAKGVVTLSGTADTADTRDKAGRAAADVEGVQSVNNRINVLSGS